MISTIENVCPECGAKEIASNSPLTKYACGSTTYDGLADTLIVGNNCKDCGNGEAPKMFTNAVTHNNGGVAFSVNKHKVFKDVVDVFKHNYRIHNVIKIFLTSSEDENSSVLVEVPSKELKYKYIFIGTEMYSFETDEPIENFYSMIGNSDVPYPVSMSNNYAYFFLDKVYMKKDIFPKDIDWRDSYKVFYELRKNKNSEMCKFMNIEEI